MSQAAITIEGLLGVVLCLCGFGQETSKAWDVTWIESVFSEFVGTPTAVRNNYRKACGQGFIYDQPPLFRSAGVDECRRCSRSS